MSPKITLVPNKIKPIFTNNSVESVSVNQAGKLKKLLNNNPIDKLKITASRFQFFKKALPAKTKAREVRTNTIGKPFAVPATLLPKTLAASNAITYVKTKICVSFTRLPAVSTFSVKSEVDSQPNEGLGILIPIKARPIIRKPKRTTVQSSVKIDFFIISLVLIRYFCTPPDRGRLAS